MISKKMLVISRLPDSPRFNISMQLEGNVKTLFFVKQGSSKVHVSFNKDSFFIGEQAVATCEVDNTKCGKDIKCFKLKFRRLIYAASKCGHKFNKNETLAKRKFPGVASGKTGTVILDMNLEVEKDNQRFQKSLPPDYIHHPCNEDLNAFMQLSVPSLMGHTMQCNYTLEVHL